MTLRHGFLPLLAVAGCFSPSAADLVATSTSGNGVTTASGESATSVHGDTTTGSGVMSTGDGSAAPTSGSDSHGTTANTSNTGLTSAGHTDSGTSDTSASTSTGPSTACSNGVAEAGELCLGEVQVFRPVNPVEKIATADMDNNGHLDLVTSEGNDAEAAFYFGAGSGTFGGYSGEAFSPVAIDVAIGRFNNDALDDVVFGIDSDATNIGVIIGDGAGTFTYPFANYGAVASARAVATGDLNGDAYDDIVAVGAVAATAGQDGRVMVFRAASNGFGGFAATPVVSSHPDGDYLDVIVADFNANAVLDIAFIYTGSAGSWLRVCRGNNTGEFPTSACETLAGGSDPRALAAGDFDGDGNIDIAASQSTANAIRIYRGRGNGTFADVDVITTREITWGLASGDLNNDGIVDLVATHPVPATASILLGDDAAPLDVDATLSMGASGYIPEDVVLGDFNEDGALDVALGCRGSVAGQPGIGVFNSNV